MIAREWVIAIQMIDAQDKTKLGLQIQSIIMRRWMYLKYMTSCQRLRELIITQSIFAARALENN